VIVVTTAITWLLLALIFSGLQKTAAAATLAAVPIAEWHCSKAWIRAVADVLPS
jgi:hypothetical protein